MATVGTQAPGTQGLVPVVAAASAGGDKILPGGRLHIINGAAAPITVTLVTPGVLDGNLAVADRTFTVPNGVFPANFGVIDVPSELYRSPADGLASITWSASASVSFFVLGAVRA